MSENMQQCPSCGELVPIEYVVCVWCGFDLTAEHIRRSGIRIGRKEAFLRMRKVVVDPINAFKEISLIPDLKGGRWVLYLIGIAMTLNMLAVFSKLDGLDFNDDSQNEVAIWIFDIQVTTIVAFTFLIVQPLILLLVFTIAWRTGTRVIISLSRALGGSGDRQKVRAVIGYSLVPVLIGWSLAWLLRLVSGSETVDDNTSYESVEAALVNVSQEGLGAIAAGIILIAWIWATVLGVIGVSKATRISYAEAIIVAGIPYIVFISIIT